MILEIVLLFLLAIIVGIVLYGRWNYGILEAMGVPVVKPTFFLGSIPDLHKKIIHEQDIEFFKTYGPVYGVYEGRDPFLYICDADLVKQVQVASFDHFRERRRVEFGDEYFNEMMDFVEHEKWKIIRQQLMPAFSPAKYKRAKSSLDESLDKFMANLSKHCKDNNRGKVNLREEAATFNVDFSAILLYGTKVSNPEDNFLRKGAKQMMAEDEEFNFMYPLSLSFPILNKLAPPMNSEALQQWKDFITHVISERRKSKMAPTGDFLDSLASILDKIDTPEFKTLKITDITAYSQGIVTFLGGYDTFSMAIVFLAYYLANAPKLQQKVLDEVDAFFEKHETVEFENASELPFLNACVMETLRLAPAFRLAERICVKDFEYNGLKIKKGVVVAVPLWAHHRNPDNFEDPEEFKPERFLPENSHNINTYANCVFGHGPRNCPGKRFAQDFLKIVTARLFKEFKFEMIPGSQFKYKTGRMFMVQFHPFYMDLIKRQ